MQLNPTEKFIISRQLADPTDSDTNFVQAVVRNAQTDAVLKAVSLSDKGSQRFTAPYEVPSDVGGAGFYITITTMVYTDAQFTTRNFNYNAEQNTYLVQQRYNNLMGSGGAGADVDYDKIENIVEGVAIDRETKAIEASKKSPKAKGPADPMPTLQTIGQTVSLCLSALQRIEKLPKFEKHDNTPVISALAALQTAITSLPDKFPKNELEPVHGAISDLTDAISESMKKHDILAKDHQELLSADVEAVREQLAAIKKEVPEANYQPVVKEMEAETKKETIHKGLDQAETALSNVTKNVKKAKPQPQAKVAKPVPTAEDLKKPILSPFNIKPNEK